MARVGMTVRCVGVAVLVGSAACGGDRGVDAGSVAARETLPAGPEVTEAQYRGVDLADDPAAGVINQQVAVTDEAVFFYGGAVPAESGSAGLVARGDGSLLDLRTEDLVDVPPWPFESPPYAPGVVAVEDVFVVLGSPCAAVAPADGSPDCGDTARAAVFDPKSGEWRPVPAPADGLELGAGSYASVAALGAADGIAFFTFRDVTAPVTSIVGFDASESEWLDLGPFASASALHCVTSSGLLRAFVSDDGSLTSERLDVESAEWQSVADGEPSKLDVPDSDIAVEETQIPAAVPPPRPRCAGDQLVAMVTGAGAPTAMYWFDDSKRVWYETPPPTLRRADYPGAAYLHDVLVLWPSAGSGDLQVLSAGDWRAISGTPQLVQPLLVRSGEEIIVVGREPGSDGALGPLHLGRLSLELG